MTTNNTKPSDLGVTSVWFAYVGWRDRSETAPTDIRDLILTPHDSYESALWALRDEAGHFWTHNMFWGAPNTPKIPKFPAFATMDELTIRDTLANAAEDHDDVLVEIREVAIINHTATGWRTLDFKAKEDALRAQPLVPEHRFYRAISSNNLVMRCIVTHNGRDYFGPWRGDEASALKAALLLIPEKG